ncbi:MAG: hypothetical protein ACJAQR_001357 [Bacteroidia bacterium]|jgi:hypothetical protein
MLLVLLPFFSSAQKEAKIPGSIAKSPELLAQHLTKDAKSKREKVDTIYNWVIRNVSYDYEKSSSGDPFFYEDESEVLKSGIGTCTGYSNLLKAMLKEVGVKSEIVYGYVHDEIIDSITVPLECTHAWIGIKLDGKWFLADPTWDAGYVGNIKTDKVEKYKEKWAKHNEKFDAAEAKIEANKLAKSDREKAYTAKLDKCKAKRTKATDKLKTKERDAKDFTGDHGFVSSPGDAWYLVSADSFLVTHLPANPMWQLRDNPVAIENFAQIKTNGQNVAAISEEVFLDYLDYDAEIRRYTRLDYLERLKWSAADAVLYNPINYQMLAQNYYNWLGVMGDNEFQEVAEDKHKVSSYKDLLEDVDSLKSYGKLAKANARTELKYTKNTYKNMHKAEVAVQKDQAKAITKGLEENEKTIEDITENMERLENGFETMTGKTAKLDENVSSRSLSTDEAAVQYYTDSLQRIANRFEYKSELWKRSLDSTYLQDVYNSLWYSLNLLDAKGYYLEVKNYTTAIYIREIDSLLNGQLAELETLYSDSLPIEMLGKDMYRDVKEMYAFMSYIKPELERLSESNEITNMNNVMAYYNKQVQGQLEDYLEMSSRAYSHCKWMKSILKDFEKLWEQASEDAENHEQLIEERSEFIDELVEAKKTRNDEFYELINESSKEWKTEFKK